MRKTILISSVLAVSAAMLCVGRPVRDASAARENSYTVAPEPEPRNTDYVQVSPDSPFNTRQATGVYVGFGTDFMAGARIVFDVTVDYVFSTTTIFSYCANYGYLYCHLNPTENLVPGRHIIEWVNQPAPNVYYHPLIDGMPTIDTYTICWQFRNGSYQLSVGGGSVVIAGDVFRGLYHGVKLYDSNGILRHSWKPYPTGQFYDEITGSLTRFINGTFIYGDLDNE